VDRSGTLISNFHKKNLNESDKNWGCKEGKEFQSIEIKNTKCDKIKCAWDINMDINPYEFQENYLYEFAHYCLYAKVECILFISG
jgi:hypothetical protein